MADKQITELTEASTLAGDELLVISQGGEARKVAAEKLAALVISTLPVYGGESE